MLNMFLFRFCVQESIFTTINSNKIPKHVQHVLFIEVCVQDIFVGKKMKLKQNSETFYSCLSWILYPENYFYP